MSLPVVLASTSPARKALLAQVGLTFEAVSPGVEERLDRNASPEGQARSLALQKAEAVAARRPDAIVIGADQVLATAEGTFGKPADAADARGQLARMAGRTHRLISAVAVLAPGLDPWVAHEETRLTVRALLPEEIDAYVATGEWEGCAGGYRVEGRGLALFERIEGDWTNVLGLPMPLLLGRLRELGVDLFAR